jgi:hypothetical protein
VSTQKTDTPASQPTAETSGRQSPELGLESGSASLFGGLLEPKQLARSMGLDLSRTKDRVKFWARVRDWRVPHIRLSTRTIRFSEADIKVWLESRRVGPPAACEHLTEPPIAAKDDDLARDMACFLWECSRLRHGLFTPPEFIPLVSARLREYLATRKPNDRREPRGNNLP